MEKECQERLAALLRAAAARGVSERDFWDQFRPLASAVGPPLAGIINETATHYWGNFHSRNILFIPVKPDVYQLMQGQDELNLIAEGLEQNWPVAELKRKLKDI